MYLAHRPRACYDEGKRVAESLCYAYAQQEKVEVCHHAEHRCPHELLIALLSP